MESADTSPKPSQPALDGAEKVKWWVLRDLKRPNGKSPAYKVLGEAGMEVFTPMVEKIVTRHGSSTSVREQVPFLPDLLFVHSAKSALDPHVERIPTLQYRYVRGGKFQEGMTVDSGSMERFIGAVRKTLNVRYYHPTEITPNQIGAYIKIVGGVFDGYEGHILKVQGSKKKRLLIDLESYMTAAVEIESEYIQIVSAK